MQIITHRGLNPSRPNYFPESTFEAFSDQLRRGYGLEFDIQLTRDKELVVFHSPDLAAISGGKDTRRIEDLTADEIRALKFSDCWLCFLEELLGTIKASSAPLSALHFKGAYQTDECLEILLRKLEGFDPRRLIIFDVKISTAQKIKALDSRWQLAASIGHPFDIKRYNEAVHGTMLTLAELEPLRHLYKWVWLDEWDRTDENGGDKKLYTPEVFADCRRMGLKIGLVTPELHATSPGLLGGEKHPDAENQEKLFARVREILALGPDLICTDYPDEVHELSTWLTK